MKPTNPFDPTKFRVVIPESKAGIRAMIEKYHYLHTWPTNAQIPMAIEHVDTSCLVGCIVFGEPGRHGLSQTISPLIPNTGVIEIQRLFIIDGKSEDGFGTNLESWAIRRAFELLKEIAPHRIVVVSYADSSRHEGTIYQASNGLFQEVSGGNSYSINEHNPNSPQEWVHSRSQMHRYGTNNLEQLGRIIPHFFYREESKKYRYIWILCGNPLKEAIFNTLRHPVLAYPKTLSESSEIKEYGKRVKLSPFRNVILNGDALTELKKLPRNSVDMCMTSPPYWALRNYGVAGQMGSEETPEACIDALGKVFEQVKRVLKPQGTCWVNLGDTYLKKSLVNIPHRFVLRMLEMGWLHRNTIIWHKPAIIPQGVGRRFAVDFEYLFFFTKCADYFFVRQTEPAVTKSFRVRTLNDRKPSDRFVDHMSISRHNRLVERLQKEGVRVKRCVWRIASQRRPAGHYATYPEELCEVPIAAGCPVGGIVLDPFFGAGTTGVVALEQNKSYLGIELNPEYIKTAEKRLLSVLPVIDLSDKAVVLAE